METQTLKSVAVVLLGLGLCIIATSAFSLRGPRNGNRGDDGSNPTLIEIRRRLEIINPNYARIPLREGSSAYTEDKHTIYLCLRDPATAKAYDLSVLMYVCLHEIAHVISKNIGHGPEFKNNFSGLLARAAEVGVYDPRFPLPEKYCGVKTGH